jgi:hypothetical protein
MTFTEYVGTSLIIFLCTVGAYVVGRCAWIGARQMWHEIGRDRREQRDFEQKVGLQ